MPAKPLTQRAFILILWGLCSFYLGFELFFNQYTILSVDEFWFAHRIYQYKDSLPYKDFAPYKTILGYYLLLLPMLSAQSIFKTLILTKHFITFINTIVLFISSLWLTRFFSRTAILISLFLLIISETFLYYSTNLRIDLFAYWFCLFSFLFLLENRFIWAGLLIGLGFVTSQKTVWFMFASNCALGINWMNAKRQTQLKNIITFNISACNVIAIYLAFWSWLVDWQTVFSSVFSEASAIYHLDWYNNARELYWSTILTHNPFLFILWPFTLLTLFITYDDDREYPKRLFVVCYSIIILLCLIPYKQMFPYYMQVAYPIFLVLYAAFFSWLFAIFKTNKINMLVIGVYGLWAILAIYILMILGLTILFQLPTVYLLICLIPCLLGFYIINQSTSKRPIYFKLISLTTLFIGAIYPLTLFTLTLIAVNGAYQKANVQLVNALLQDGSGYVAGVELIYNKTQPIAGMRQLIGPAISYLYTPSPTLRKVMLASLYEDPNVTSTSVIDALKKSPVKFYVNNYRMQGLPDNIKQYLAKNYEHFWGSIYLYAPTVPKGHQQFRLAFSGNYLIESTHQSQITLNSHHYQTKKTIYLKNGYYTSNTKTDYRLKLLPTLTLPLDPAFQNDRWGKMIF